MLRSQYISFVLKRSATSASKKMKSRVENPQLKYQQSAEPLIWQRKRRQELPYIWLIPTSKVDSCSVFDCSAGSTPFTDVV